jgi:adenylylsulfate kinase-like enzyme
VLSLALNNIDLGLHDADRVENIRRVNGVARLLVDAGLIPRLRAS